MGTTAPLRLWRSSAVTATVLALASAAHVVGGGRMPGLPVMVLLAALLNVPVVLLAGRRMGMATLAGILGAGQWMLHHAFTWFAGAQPCSGTHASASGGHIHDTHALVSSCVASAHPAHVSDAHLSPAGAPMVAAHLLAILATAFVLAKGEDALCMLIAWLSPLASVPRPAAIPAPGPRAHVTGWLPLLPARSNARAERHRGPPRRRRPGLLPA